jgi:hypothetical protein
MFMREPRVPADLAFGFDSTDCFVDENGEPLRILTSQLKEESFNNDNIINLFNVLKEKKIQKDSKLKVLSIWTDDFKYTVKSIGRVVAPQSDNLSFILTELVQKENVDLLYIVCTKPPKVDIPIITGMPVVRIAPWIDSLSKKPNRWVYIYSKKHLDPNGISMQPIMKPYFFTKNIYSSIRGVLAYNGRFILDPQILQTVFTRNCTCLAEKVESVTEMDM